MNEKEAVKWISGRDFVYFGSRTDFDASKALLNSLARAKREKREMFRELCHSCRDGATKGCFLDLKKTFRWNIIDPTIRNCPLLKGKQK
jgi:acyl-CoA hydrolase